MRSEKKLAYCLFGLRITVFFVMLMWTLDKLVNPGHAMNVFSNFYGLPVGSSSMTAVAIVELGIIIAFVLGAYRRWTYAAVLVFHTISTLASFGMYRDPWQNLLFFAAWPMLAACITLYALRDADTFLTIQSGRRF